VCEEIVTVADLPDSFIEAVARSLQQHTVAFIDADVRSDETGLLGSGTLVRIDGRPVILTAHHVLSVLPRSGRLGLLLEKTPELHTIDTQGVAFVDIARGDVAAIGPDLGAIVLSAPIGAAIDAKKVFTTSTHDATRC
jgi:hypothetical protein